MQVMPWDFGIILLILAVPIPLLGRRRVRQLLQQPHTSKLERLLLYASTIVFQWTIVGIIMWRTFVRGVHPTDLALAISHIYLTVDLSALLSAVFFANQFFALRRLEQHPPQQTGILVHLATKVFPQDRTERLFFCALVLTVAICEELIYRGFVQFVFQRLTTSVLLGILFSSLFFAFAHFYQGRRGVISTFIVGIVFASVRAWTGSLVPSIAAHFVADLTAGVWAPIRLRRAAIDTFHHAQELQ